MTVKNFEFLSLTSQFHSLTHSLTNTQEKTMSELVLSSPRRHQRRRYSSSRSPVPTRWRVFGPLPNSAEFVSSGSSTSTTFGKIRSALEASEIALRAVRHANELRDEAMECIHRDLHYSDDVEELDYLKKERERLLRYDDIVSCRSSETRLLDVRIPSRAFEGSTFEVRVPGDDRMLTVRVPRGVVPGDVVTVRFSPSDVRRRRGDLR